MYVCLKKKERKKEEKINLLEYEFFIVVFVDFWLYFL